MATGTNNSYLRDAVMTATPEQLQLMLYDGAIRFATQGREAVVNKQHEQAYENLSRAQRIILEMQQGLNHDVAPELCDRMASLYGFLYRKLVEGCVQRDVQAIDDALRILDFERETWVMLMQKLSEERAQTQPGQTDDSGADATAYAGTSLSIEG